MHTYQKTNWTLKKYCGINCIRNILSISLSIWPKVGYYSRWTSLINIIELSNISLLSLIINYVSVCLWVVILVSIVDCLSFYLFQCLSVFSTSDYLSNCPSADFFAFPLVSSFVNKTSIISGKMHLKKALIWFSY